MLVMSLLFYGCETVPPETKITINNTLNISNKANIDKSKQVFKVIKVGLFLPLSGSNAKIGKSILNATQLSLSKTQKGNIEVFVRDTEDINKNIISSYYELINKDVDIILGPFIFKKY
jgi:ABC-type branched-subunit amino acid transport system substrate-binding protein